MDSTISHQNTFKIKFLILLTFWFFAFFPLYPKLIHIWLNDSYNSHGLLVPFISLYLFYQKREKLKSATISSSNWGGVILVISIGLYLLSYAGKVGVISHLMIVLSLVGLVLFTLGKNVFNALAFPLLFLFFMIPVPQTIVAMSTLPLQLFAAEVSASLIRILNISVYQEGTMLYFAQTQLEVAEACSGIRSITSFIILSILLCYVLKGWGRKTILLASTIPVALFTNIVRITGTGMLAHFYGAEIAQGFLHEFSGIVVFAFGFILLFIEFTLLHKVSRKQVGGE